MPTLPHGSEKDPLVMMPEDVGSLVKSLQRTLRDELEVHRIELIEDVRIELRSRTAGDAIIPLPSLRRSVDVQGNTEDKVEPVTRSVSFPTTGFPGGGKENTSDGLRFIAGGEEWVEAMAPGKRGRKSITAWENNPDAFELANVRQKAEDVKKKKHIMTNMRPSRATTRVSARRIEPPPEPCAFIDVDTRVESTKRPSVTLASYDNSNFMTRRASDAHLRNVNKLSIPASSVPVGKAPEDPVKRMVMSTWFDSVVCVALIVNAILIGIQADRAARHQDASDFRVLEVIFCVFFTLELILRLYTYRLVFFTCGDKWNYFDLTLVLLQLVDEGLREFFGPLSTDGMLSDMSIVRLVRVLRLLRILRLLRVIRFVSELKKVLYLIMGSLGSFCWTAILLMLLIYILAVFFTQIIADQTESLDAGAIVLVDFFGSTTTSIHTLYKAITGGFDWQEASQPLIENVSPFVGIVFAGYIAFAVLVLLNLVTGVFVDGALKLSRADKEIELLQKGYELFDTTDVGTSGEITWTEFESHLDTKEMAQFFEVLEINLARAEDLFHLIDQNQEGKLGLEELVAGGLMLQGPAKAIDVASIAKLLQQSMNHISMQLALHMQQTKTAPAARRCSIREETLV